MNSAKQKKGSKAKSKNTVSKTNGTTSTKLWKGKSKTKSTSSSMSPKLTASASKGKPESKPKKGLTSSVISAKKPGKLSSQSAKPKQLKKTPPTPGAKEVKKVAGKSKSVKKTGLKRKRTVSESKGADGDKAENSIQLEATRYSDEPAVKKPRWVNKQRALVFSSRGIDYRGRHLMLDMRTLMPHTKADTKMDKKDKLFEINEICEMKNCNKCIFFEAKKKKDLYMWISNVPNGPSAKFLVENVHTMEELKMTGNCLKGSRPLLTFDANFSQQPHWSLLRELFTQVFSTPKHHPKSQPFIDHTFTFGLVDNRIFFRNYQHVDGCEELAEVGPRFVLNPIKIFAGSFRGEVLYENPSYISPNAHRRTVKQRASEKYRSHLQQKATREARPTGDIYTHDPTDEVFNTA